MKKRALLILFIFLLIASVSAANLTVEKIDRGNVVISEIGNPAKFDFKITNPGEPENFEIYSLLSVVMMPKNYFKLSNGETNLEVEAYPTKELREEINGYYTFEYQIKGWYSGIFKDKLTIKIVKLSDALLISAESFSPEDSQTDIIVKNLEKAEINNLSLHFTSPFFDLEKNIDLKPEEEIKIPVSINLENTKNLDSGSYVIIAETNIDGKKIKIDGTFNYLEKERISVSEDFSGFLIRKHQIVKTNEGNVPVNARIEIKKDILTRLFSIYSETPSSAERSGLFVNYVWEKSLRPGESFEVVGSTNYTFPFILILLVIVVGFIVKMYYSTNVVLTKRVSFVKTKGEQFALKVKLIIKSKKGVENVKVIDRLPGATKLYEKYGVKPDKIDHSTRRLIWNIKKLNAGEERVYSYIIYSELKILGRFELPSAVAIYDLEGKSEEVKSNKTYFMHEGLNKIED